MQPEQSSEDLLVNEFYYERASSGKRLANYVIDIIVFYIFMALLGVILALTAPEIIYAIAGNDTSGFNLLDRLISLVLYGLFMSLVEAALKGKSVGKYITGTRAVNLDGTPITVASAFGRGFSRAVPFNAFSALGTECNPWHDRWTNTVVVNDKKVI